MIVQIEINANHVTIQGAGGPIDSSSVANSALHKGATQLSQHTIYIMVVKTIIALRYYIVAIMERTGRVDRMTVEHFIEWPLSTS